MGEGERKTSPNTNTNTKSTAKNAAVPDSIGHYQILEDRTASGGPIRARDLHAGRTVLIRRIDRARLTDTALAAARTATTISHPNVASVYELAEDESGPYVVTEFVAGDALDKVLDGRPMNPRRALEVAAQLADGLAEVHSLGLVHGDIRPATVAITSKGQVKLFDVGVPLAAIGPPVPAGSSSAKSPAPEQALGLPTDARTDLFSFGTLLYTMVVGEPPFAVATTADPVDGGAARQVRAAHDEEPVAAARSRSDSRTCVESECRDAVSVRRRNGCRPSGGVGSCGNQGSRTACASRGDALLE